jgi:2-polyprenyl-3-methyl-5-hydroxy-6-metoxy-1,4-benzoquinol methylase
MDPRVKDFFDHYAVDFNAIYGTESGLVSSIVSRLFRKSMKLRYFMTMEGCQPVADKTVLDIGCGPGHYAVSLAKMGAKSVTGIDFADGMLNIARERAAREGVQEVCRFEKLDFLSHDISERFDYVVVMGFMDYVANPKVAVRRVLELTNQRAFFSFPKAAGLLAWQRQLRYRNRCPLFLYTKAQIQQIFAIDGIDVSITEIERDFFASVMKK